MPHPPALSAPPVPLRVALYTRVSTDIQVERDSLAGQRGALRTFALAQGYVVVHEYEDGGLSGTLSERERPALRQLMADAERRAFDLVLVFRLDRLARNTYLTHRLIGELREAGVHFQSMEDKLVDTRDPMSDFGISLSSLFAAREREAMIVRFSAGLRSAVTRGRYPGGIVAYGYRVSNGLLEIDEAEAEVVREVFHRSAALGESTIKIARALNDRGVPTKYVREGRGVRHRATAGVWTPGAVRRLLTNRTYTGVYEYGKRRRRGAEPRPVTLGTAPIIVSPEVFAQAAETLRRNLLISTRNAKQVYLLRSLIKCAACGRTYIGTKNAKSDAYSCGGRNNRRGEPDACKCRNPNVRATELEQHVWAEITRFIEQPATVALAQQLAAADDRPGELERLGAQLAELQGQKERLSQVYALGRLSFETYDAQYTKIEARVLTLKAAVSALQDDARREEERSGAYRRLETLRAELVGRLQTLDPTARQHLAHQLVRRISVAPDRTVKVEYNF